MSDDFDTHKIYNTLKIFFLLYAVNQCNVPTKPLRCHSMKVMK